MPVAVRRSHRHALYAWVPPSASPRVRCRKAFVTYLLTNACAGCSARGPCDSRVCRPADYALYVHLRMHLAAALGLAVPCRVCERGPRGRGAPGLVACFVAAGSANANVAPRVSLRVSPAAARCGRAPTSPRPSRERGRFLEHRGAFARRFCEALLRGAFGFFCGLGSDWGSRPRVFREAAGAWD